MQGVQGVGRLIWVDIRAVTTGMDWDVLGDSLFVLVIKACFLEELGGGRWGSAAHYPGWPALCNNNVT